MDQANATLPYGVEKLEQLPKIPFHGLRHTCATLLNDMGINILTISKMLGHAQTSTTMNIYAHSFESQLREASNHMNGFLQKCGEKMSRGLQYKIEGKIHMPEKQCEIKKEIGVISEGLKGSKKELNLISWYGREPKYDIRDWRKGHEKSGKGITLSVEEVKQLREILWEMDI